MEENHLLWYQNGINHKDVFMHPVYSKQADQIDEEVVYQLGCLEEEINKIKDADPKAQKYDDISEASDCGEIQEVDGKTGEDSITDVKKGISIVELEKKDGVNLGLTISGGIDKNCRPRVSHLRPGSIAHRCGAIAVGDYIISVNKIGTCKLKHEEIVNLLKNAGSKVTLVVEYEIPVPYPRTLLSEQTPFVWMYPMNYPTDPPQYIPGFSLKLPLKYTFEFIFPNLFRRMCLPPPSIPKIFLYWTCRNPTVLQHMMEKIAYTSIGMVVDSLKKKTAVRTLFWKVGLTALFGSYDASMLLRFAAYRLLKNDWESAFYLYVAAMTRIARKLETSKNESKHKDKDFGKVKHSLNNHVVRKHPRMKKVIIKMKPKTYCSILKTKSLVKKSFHIKNVHIREIFKETKESNSELVTFVTFKEDVSAEKIGEDLAYELAFSDCGEKSIDKDFEYQYLSRESDEAYMKEWVSTMLKDERVCDIIEEPAPDLEEDVSGENAFSKIVHFNFPSKPSLQNQEHSEYCVGSLFNPDISYLTKQVIGYILKSSFTPLLLKMPAFDIPIKCMDIETTKQVFQNVLSASVKSWFRHTSRAHPILELPLEYLDVDLYFLIRYMSKKNVHKDERGEELIELFSKKVII